MSIANTVQLRKYKLLDSIVKTVLGIISVVTAVSMLRCVTEPALESQIEKLGKVWLYK